MTDIQSEIIGLIVLSICVLIYKLYSRKCNKEEILSGDKNICEHEYDIIDRIETTRQIQYINRCKNCGYITDTYFDKI